MAEQRTWDRSREIEENDWAPGWLPLGFQRQECGCLVDTFTEITVAVGKTSQWRPCMAHEGDGHLAVISEQSGMYVARCLVGTCPWKAEEFWSTEVIAAAERHWAETAAPVSE